MLSRLSVQNLALIEKLELSFCDQLNILSGETGAGKSIIVDGIMLLLGARYDKTLLRYGANSGFVEGVFDVTERALEVMRALGWEDDECIIIHRKFFADGKNEIRINGRPATTSMLKQLTATLVDIYGQNEYQSLARASEHLRILDYYVRNTCKSVKEKYAQAYGEYKNTLARLRQIGNAEERVREMDLLRYQITEIDEAHTFATEEEELIERRNMITSAEKIYAAIGQAVYALSEREEGAASELLSDAEREIGSIAGLKSTFAELYDRLQSAAIEIGDIADSLRDELDGMQFDQNELDALEKRLAFVRTLKRKYGNFTEMEVYKSKAAARLSFLENADDQYAELTEQKDRLLQTLYDTAQTLHTMRVNGAAEFAEKIKKELQGLGMEKADFAVQIPDFPSKEVFAESFGSAGADTAEFYLSPNVGQPLKPLIKIISGGEMSRFMLALKVISNESDDMPTMIFDEIDAGISGLTGRVVAQKLAEISGKHQVLCVTHLAQIAAMADAHFFIRKETRENATVTCVTPLSPSGMIDEISRLSGGKGISAQSDGNAETMKQWSDAYKATLRA